MLITNSLAVTRYLLGGSDNVTRGGSPPGGTSMGGPVAVSLWTAKTSVCFGSGSAITVYARNSCPRGAGQGKCSAIRGRETKGVMLGYTRLFWSRAAAKLS